LEFTIPWELTLTSDNDPQLQALTERVNGMTSTRKTAMIKIAQYGKAEDLHKIWLTQTTGERQKADIYYQLGCIKFYQGRYSNALTFFENWLTIQTKNSPCK
jgi:tetratricopeptide (TPR) repeat protein